MQGRAAGGVICLVVHTVLGLAPETFVIGLCDFIIIYGMLAVRDYTGNALGLCADLFFLLECVSLAVKHGCGE